MLFKVVYFRSIFLRGSQIIIVSPNDYIFISNVYKIVMVDSTKFFFYEMTALDENLKPMKIGDMIKSINLEKGARNIKIEDTKGKLVYEIRISKINEEFYFGKILKTKETDEYFVKGEKTNLRELGEEVNPSDRVGRKKWDMAYFLFRVKKKKLTVLTEVGFQTPGIGRLRNFFEKILNKKIEKKIKRIDYEVKMTKKVKDSLRTFKDLKLKKVKMKFKKDPELPEDCDNLENALSMLGSGDYCIKMSMSLGRVGKEEKKNAPSFKEFYKKIFGQKLKLNQKNIDFPSFLVNFTVEAIDKDDETISDNLVERYEKVSICFDKSDIKNDSQLADLLISKFKDKMNIEG